LCEGIEQRRENVRPIICSALLLTAGCAGGAAPAADDPTLGPVVARAEAVLVDSVGRRVGVATFIEREDGVSIGVSVTGLPAGEHGLHIHETGVCDAPSFESAGGHFAPEGRPHGTEAEGGPHAGDLPNLVVGEHGTGRLGAHNDRVSLGDGDDGLLEGDGTALVLHAGADDHRSQPSGDSGGRIACGVIEGT
jgi:superoxide dismutase, Cu-Zn family